MSGELIGGHLDGLHQTLENLRQHEPLLRRWGRVLAHRLSGGHRLLAAGNGGSAAEAQHLTAELVGRFREDRRPFSAIALCAESSSVTAIGNDYGYEEVFARQVRAHAGPLDIVVLLSTSGRSPNLVRAAEAAREAGATSWACTGPAPNPLAEIADETLALDGPSPNVQEAQLVLVHLLCTAFEAELSTMDTLARRRVS
ncbi:SIS domain-containing protein [Crossiella sp. SN42]|uniref:D-sedoheptulose-7-phosphate isomerase n=1 Tax=Crossiella sp. SN42 TaxID=2944808 RepID=UPI00207CFEB1|nr:SIS domain-containing protein [Crossiella sp. SN42]MCO1576297.1 SIS domain-containing protein [Crossiella sp. SN42]